jgi:hypothetical protein
LTETAQNLSQAANARVNKLSNKELYFLVSGPPTGPGRGPFWPGPAGRATRQAAARPGPTQAGRAGVVARPGPPEAGRHIAGRQNNMH